MLKNIKSSYFSKIIFSFIDEGQKLKIVKYNKGLQKNIDIDLVNYKFFSKKYIINESNGISKVYDGFGDDLIFEGDLNGKGKEYRHYFVIFEGEYLNGKKNGKGKEYYYEGELLFDGEYLNGKKNGKGKEYYKYSGKLKFEGEYLNNKKLIGKGYDESGQIIYETKNNSGLKKEYYDYGNLEFEGEYMNGLRNGKGKEYYKNHELKFEGRYLNGKRHGKGKEYFGSLIFDCEYLNGDKWEGKVYDPINNKIYELKEGKGYIKEKYDIEEYFLGEYLNGKRNGKGKIYNYNNELRFDGEFLNGKINGKGKEFNDKGYLIFEGEYLYNYRLKGKIFIDKRLEYEGEFLFNKKWNGKGYDENGNLIYELINGNGTVKEYNDFKGKLKFEGEYLNGKKNGKGKEYCSTGKLIFEGEYINGKRNGKGKEYHYIYDNLIFEGEYLNGTRWKGIEKEYDFDNNFKCEKLYINSKKV